MTVDYNIRYIKRTPNTTWKDGEEKDLSDSDCSVEVIPINNSIDLPDHNNGILTNSSCTNSETASVQTNKESSEQIQNISLNGEMKWEILSDSEILESKVHQGKKTEKSKQVPYTLYKSHQTNSNKEGWILIKSEKISNWGTMLSEIEISKSFLNHQNDESNFDSYKSKESEKSETLSNAWGKKPV
ncbi:hypothetical protein ILUMI_12992 [Ignelater luminosus]|uniref:Uncharacterized protein n=1 Tax=Ignelater luminosus TaxID=2038154 RepID=A0A8K0CT55_IGNLU|nr:hypothetical protein ILUMI_12992 [Ignelater luminosus]